MFKLGTLYGDNDVECQYGNIYEIQRQPTWSRVAIGANDRQIPLLLEIAKTWRGPYGILYVLITSRLGHEPGRYQSPEPCNFDALEVFAYTFQEYFERGGRHNLWLMDLSSHSQVIYDNHDIIYAYGNIEWYSQFLEARGFSRQDMHIACPHSHYYNPEFDRCEDDILKYWDWKHFPLQDQDDP